MPPTAVKKNTQDPDQLASEARILLGASDEAITEPTEIEIALRHAFKRVAADLDVIERASMLGQEIDYAGVLGAQIHEKIADIIYLAKYKLQDMAHCPGESLDIEFARRDVALSAEILFRLGAADGLGILYDLSANTGHLAPETAKFWQVVARRTLLLLTLVNNNRQTAAYFLAARPPAQAVVENLIATNQPPTSTQLQTVLQHSRQLTGAPDPGEVPAYVKIYQHLDADLGYEGAYGVCSLINAEHRLHKALDEDDLASLVKWFLEGSRVAVGEFLRYARTKLPPHRYTELLGMCFVPRRADSRRLAAVVVELGELNRARHPEGGDANVNELLVETTMTTQKNRVGVARLAVRELTTVGNHQAILYIAEKAPLLPVAEEAIMALMRLRRLFTAEPTVEARPELLKAFRTAHKQLVEIQNLVDAIWSTDSEELIAEYIARLQALDAQQELAHVEKLINRTHTYGGHANR